MKKNMINLFLILSTLNSFAQSNFENIRSVDSFKALLTEKTEQLNSIESDFIQTKHIDMLSENIISKGKFYYKKPNRVCLDYIQPVKYLIVINNDKIKINSEGKINIYTLGENKMMKEMNNLISACMTGNLNLLTTEYKLEYKENADLYWIIVYPRGSAQTYMQEIHIYLDKKDLSVHQLNMIESSSDYTEYLFTNKKQNHEISDEKFSLR